MSNKYSIFLMHQLSEKQNIKNTEKKKLKDNEFDELTERLIKRHSKTLRKLEDM